MKKKEYHARLDKMNNAILQWIIKKNPPEDKINYAMMKAEAVGYHWMHQVTDWDKYDILAMALFEKKG